MLREQLEGRRLRFNDDQRRRLAAKAKGLGRKILDEFATIATPETLRRCRLTEHDFRSQSKRKSLRHSQRQTSGSCAGNQSALVTLAMFSSITSVNGSPN